MRLKLSKSRRKLAVRLRRATAYVLGYGNHGGVMMPPPLAQGRLSV